MSSLELIVDRDESGRVVLKSPGVGVWRQAPAIGELAQTGHHFGCLEVLGRRRDLLVPAGVRGVVLESCNENDALVYGQTLAVLGAELGAAESAEVEAASATSDGALVFRSTSSGRFYLRPAPDKPPFVQVGDEIETGHTIFLLEVMKTFSRVHFEGEGMPARAKVLSILPKDGDDLEPGQVVLELEEIQ
jgi:acetyl-CoA carboxylase biotin carboxyl carrier protein